MRATTLLAATAIALTASTGLASAADRAPGTSAETFGALKDVRATALNRTEMRAVTGAFNLFRFEPSTGTVVFVGSFDGNFQNTPGFNNVIVGCGGAPQPTIFSSPSC